MKAEIISVGSELLRGELVDTNAPYLASQLILMGIDLDRTTVVGDVLSNLVEVIKKAWQSCGLVIITGGLGPTEDDLTREAIAQVMGEELKVDPELERWLRVDVFGSRGMAMPERNIRQAMLIPSAKPIPNPRGTAPGWWLEKGGKVLIAMPGPPSEMERMWLKEILPHYASRLVGGAILVRTLKSFGLGEASVDEALTPVVSCLNPIIGIYAKPDGIHISISARAPSQEEAQRMVGEMETRIKTLLGSERIWGMDMDTLEGVVGQVLVEKGLTLATMESCTGGLLADTITNIPGCSKYYKGGLVAYSNEMKIASGVKGELIQRFGAISPQVAESMATCVRQRLGSDIGVGITGVAGPDEVEGKPPGTIYVAIDAKGRVSTFAPSYRFDRLRLKRVTVTAALFHLRRILLQL